MRKLLYFALLAGSLVLVSFHGGTAAWMLWYFMLLIPVLALLYTLYVYLRFRIGQEVPRAVNKGEYVPYRLRLTNEDFILMSGFGLNFFTETVQVMKKNIDGITVPYEEAPENIFLPPYTGMEIELELYCKYRGLYPVGVKSISVTDFFGIFTITYPLRSQIRLTAYPRILSIAQLQSKIKKMDSKKSKTASAQLQELLDYELRKYIPGDSLRQVHWKNSARAGELLVRKRSPQELTEIVVLMDCTSLENRTKLERMQIEDNIVETVIALVHDACMKKIRTRIVWSGSTLKKMQIDSPKDFEKFYSLSACLPFEASMTLEMLWKACGEKLKGNPIVWLVGCNVEETLVQKTERSRKLGKTVILIDTGEEPL